MFIIVMESSAHNKILQERKIKSQKDEKYAWFLKGDYLKKKKKGNFYVGDTIICHTDFFLSFLKIFVFI